jgi:type II secretory pathway pseudopilin PulG
MTLPEVMIAASVMLVCLVSLAGLLGGSITSSASAHMRDEAANIANDRLETARSLNYDRVGLHYTNGLYGDPAYDQRLDDFPPPKYPVIQDGTLKVNTWVEDSNPS